MLKLKVRERGVPNFGGGPGSWEKEEKRRPGGNCFKPIGSIRLRQKKLGGKETDSPQGMKKTKDVGLKGRAHTIFTKGNVNIPLKKERRVEGWACRSVRGIKQKCPA